LFWLIAGDARHPLLVFVDTSTDIAGPAGPEVNASDRNRAPGQAQLGHATAGITLDASPR
jgi:hypothetical protein